MNRFSAKRTHSFLAAAALALAIAPASILIAQTPAGGLPAVQQRANQPQQQGGLTFSEPRFEFGQVSEGDNVEHYFEFTNSSQQTITITRASASCGCTVPTLEKTVYEPGESGKIKAIFNSRGRFGNQSNTITVETDNVMQPVIRLSMAGTVIRESRLLPSHNADFRTVRHGTSEEITIELIDSSGESIEITELSSTNPHVTLTEGEREEITDELTGKPGVRIPIKVALSSEHPMEPLRGAITVRTTSSTNPAHALRLTGEVVGEVRVSPNNVPFGLVQVGQSTSRAINITVADNTRFELKGYEFDGSNAPGGAMNMANPPIKVEQMEASRGRSHAVINVTLENPAEAGRLAGTVVIKGEIGEENNRREVSIPVNISGAIRAAPGGQRAGG